MMFRLSKVPIQLVLISLTEICSWRLVLILIVFFLTGTLLAQNGLVKSIPVDDVKLITVDRAGDVYVTTSSAIKKFDKDGTLLNTLATPLFPTSFDTGNGVRLLTYYRKDQQYTILTPSLTKTSETPIDNSIAIDPWLLCSSGDYNILILDAADWSIKKIDARQSNVIAEFKIDSTLTKNPDFISMREYQNFIFLLDRHTGISIFNAIGIKLKTVTVPDLTTFNFLGEELYYYKNGTIYFVDLFTTETRQENIKGTYQTILVTDERLIGLRENRIEIFEYHPQ